MYQKEFFNQIIGFQIILYGVGMVDHAKHFKKIYLLSFFLGRIEFGVRDCGSTGELTQVVPSGNQILKLIHVAQHVG